MAGMFDSDQPGGSMFNLMDPNSMAIMGALAGLGQAGAASRMPITPAQVWGGLGGGLMAGQMASQKAQLAQQEMSGDALKNALLMNQLGQQAGALGQPAPSMRDIRSGKWQGFPWAQMFNEPDQAPSAGPQMPMPTQAQQPSKPPVGLPSGVNLSGANQDIVNKVMQSASTNGIDPTFAVSHIRGESNFDPAAVGPAVTGNSLYPGHPQPRPLGLAQFDMQTAKDWGVSDPFNPDQALTGYGKYFSNLLDKNGGDYVKATQAYGTIPHDLSKMDQNQAQVYNAALAANERTKSAPIQLAQNTTGNSGTDTGVPRMENPPMPEASNPAPMITGLLTPKQVLLYQARSNAYNVAPDDVTKAWLNASLAPPNSPLQQLQIQAAQKAAGISSFVNTRGQPPLRYNPQTGNQEVNQIPGYNQALAAQSMAQASGPAQYQPQPIVEPGTGTPFATSRAAALAPGAPPVQTGLSPEAHAAAEAGGRVAAENQGKFGPLLNPPAAAQPPASDTSTPQAPPLQSAPQGIQQPQPAGLPSPKIPAAGEKLQPVPLQAAMQNQTYRQYNPIDTGRGTIVPARVDESRPTTPAQLEAAIPAWQKTETEWTASVNPAAQAEQRLQTIANAFKILETGKLAESKAEMAAYAKNLGIDASKLLGDPAAAELALHENYIGTLQRLKANTSRFTQQEFRVISGASESANIQPSANLQMLGEDIATVRRAQQLPQDWGTAKQLGWQNPQSFETQWNAANPLSKTVDQVKQEIGPLKGMPGYQAPQSAPSKTATGPNGHQLYLQNGKWIDSVTNQPFVPALAPPVR